jgi:hypothetical protein
MELKTSGPNMLVKSRADCGRLLGRARNDDQTKQALTDQLFKLRHRATNLNVSAALARHVIRLSTEINANQLKHWSI